MAPLCGAMEEGHGGQVGPVPAAVALGLVAPRALTLPEAATDLSPKEEEKGLAKSVCLPPASTH